MPVEDQASAKVKESSKTRQGYARAHSTPAHPTTILLSVAGLSPQVITETLYCLFVQRAPPTDVRKVGVAGSNPVSRSSREAGIVSKTACNPGFFVESGTP